jgi:hypothetical protein
MHIYIYKGYKCRLRIFYPTTQVPWGPSPARWAPGLGHRRPRCRRAAAVRAYPTKEVVRQVPKIIFHSLPIDHSLQQVSSDLPPPPAGLGRLTIVARHRFVSDEAGVGGGLGGSSPEWLN